MHRILLFLVAALAGITLFAPRAAQAANDPTLLWQSIETATGQTYNWVEGSTYVKLPPLFEDMKPEPAPVSDVHGARPLLVERELELRTGVVR